MGYYYTNTKTCNFCGEDKLLYNFVAIRRRPGEQRGRCKQCERAHDNDFRWCTECEIYYPRKHFQKKDTKCKKCRSTQSKKLVADLHDSYIKGKIASTTGASATEIPDSLIQAKRAHLQIVRTLREDKKS